MANDMDRRPVRPLTARLAPLIKQFMRDKKITQMKLAEELDRDQSYISERVTGKRAFTTDELDAIAKLADMEPRAFVELLSLMLGDQLARRRNARNVGGESKNEVPADHRAVAEGSDPDAPGSIDGDAGYEPDET
jgi:plasmid maintenance system antidote protein VapI